MAAALKDQYGPDVPHTIATMVQAVYPAFDPRLYGYDRLLTLVQEQSFLTVDVDGSSTRVALKGKKLASPAKKAPVKKAPGTKPPAKK